MTLRTFYAYDHEAPAEPDPVEEPVDDRHSIKWGYNLADIRRFTRVALARSRDRGGFEVERYEAAWSAIAEHLCTATERPEPPALIHAGWSASMRHRSDLSRFDGYDSHRSQTKPRFYKCWTPPAGTPIEDRVIDTAALWQILPTLTPRQRQALTALAATDDHALAAAAMGQTLRGYEGTLSRARRSFLSLWHEGETPSRLWRHDQRHARRDPSGTRITESQLETIRARAAAGETQAQIAADYGVTRSAISQLLRGKNKPAPEFEGAS